jgi:hypothetical protein
MVGETIVFSRWAKRGSGVVVVACEKCALLKKQNKKLRFFTTNQSSSTFYKSLSVYL